ncbi:C-terminal binding protein [Paenibacillus spongiae]|uniref:C-terminal binding protein n=1 Tax=Paenibacillus spongiae TaxID=2909671 RepID=A0ABY5SAJ2_9BACL|nr:C-terminal binding protein [Paenibacillus spongiae]UVI29550.1 C-terminal binding protein [Paenibacillus spongiae]
MSKYKVAITDCRFPNIDLERQVLEPLDCEIRIGQCETENEILDLCEDADAVLTQWAPVTARAIKGMNRCKGIVRYGIGVDNVDLEAANQCSIPVVNIPDYAIDEVADHTLALLLSLVRKIPQIASQVRSGVWDIAPCRPIIGLQNKQLGLAGFGNIARAVAKRAQAFGLRVTAYDPNVDEEQFRIAGVEQTNWTALLQNSDILCAHLPLSQQTRHMLDKAAFARMKPTSYLINTSRGGVIDTEALIEALQNREIAGAALDVLEHEPISKSSPLLSMEQCIITSHCAWYSEDSLQRLQLYAALEIKRLLTGERPKHIVNSVQF